MDLGIKGRRAIVTGGSSGIGFETARQLLEEGVRVLITGRNQKRLEQARDELAKRTGGEIHIVVADMTKESDIAKMIDTAKERLGGVDILVNNAAVRPNTKITAVSVEEWDRVLDTNLRGPFFLSQAVLPGMVRRKWGRIVNIGGVDAYWGKTRRPHNVAAKLGLVGLTRTLANEVARHGVTVNVVVPGTTDTYRHTPEWYPELDRMYDERKERTPMARLGTPREVADACVFLASELASYTTAQEFFVTGGAFPLVRSPSEEYPPEQFGDV
jgi:3-oxoacyl-[acyl-carrier protein] reductase